MDRNGKDDTPTARSAVDKKSGQLVIPSGMFTFSGSGRNSGDKKNPPAPPGASIGTAATAAAGTGSRPHTPDLFDKPGAQTPRSPSRSPPSVHSNLPSEFRAAGEEIDDEPRPLLRRDNSNIGSGNLLVPAGVIMDVKIEPPALPDRQRDKDKEVLLEKEKDAEREREKVREREREKEKEREKEREKEKRNRFTGSIAGRMRHGGLAAPIMSTLNVDSEFSLQRQTSIDIVRKSADVRSLLSDRRQRGTDAEAAAAASGNAPPAGSVRVTDRSGVQPDSRDGSPRPMPKLDEHKPLTPTNDSALAAKKAAMAAAAARVGIFGDVPALSPNRIGASGSSSGPPSPSNTTTSASSAYGSGRKTPAAIQIPGSNLLAPSTALLGTLGSPLSAINMVSPSNGPGLPIMTSPAASPGGYANAPPTSPSGPFTSGSDSGGSPLSGSKPGATPAPPPVAGFVPPSASILAQRRGSEKLPLPGSSNLLGNPKRRTTNLKRRTMERLIAEGVTRKKPATAVGFSGQSAADRDRAASDGSSGAPAAGGPRRSDGSIRPLRPRDSIAYKKKLVLKLILKCADVSNAAKPFALYKQWAYNIMAEFWKQGDMERSRGLPVSKYMDRTTASIAPPPRHRDRDRTAPLLSPPATAPTGSPALATTPVDAQNHNRTELQLHFISHIVRPLYATLAKVMGATPGPGAELTARTQSHLQENWSLVQQHALDVKPRAQSHDVKASPAPVLPTSTVVASTSAFGSMSAPSPPPVLSSAIAAGSSHAAAAAGPHVKK